MKTEQKIFPNGYKENLMHHRNDSYKVSVGNHRRAIENKSFDPYLPATLASKVKATRNLPGFSTSGSSLKLSFFKLTSFLIVTAF